MSQKAFILLGRLGDLINALPIFQSEAKAAGSPAHVVCCKEYASLFEGVSYAKPIPFAGTETELRKALAETRAAGYEPVSLQVIGDTLDVRDFTYGPAGQQNALTDSFQKEPYQLLKQQALLAQQPRPVFDRRNKARELKLIDSLPHDPKDCILVASKGKSSPFLYDDLLFELLRSRFRGRFHIIDLSTIEAERFYDFLGVLHNAKCLVSVDTAFLHLAHGCAPLPVCALTNDAPGLWFGSAWRCNHISYIRYKDFPFRATEMLDAIENIGSQGSVFNKATTPSLIHVWSQYEVTEESEPRHELAKATWKECYADSSWVTCPVEPGSIGRDSKAHPRIKDGARFPFLKDVIRLACYRAEENDIIVLTRCDTAMSKDMSSRICRGSLPAYAHRRYQQDDSESWHPAVDLFAFTKKWWQEHYKDLPDFILGTDQFWNRSLLSLMLENKAREIEGVSRPPSTAKVPAGARNQYNEKLYTEFQAQHGEMALARPVVEQLPGVTINRHALETYAYNPTIIQHKGKLLCCYRYHDQRDLSTAMAMAEIDAQGHVLRRIPLRVPHGGGSEEDPRFFMRGDDLWLSYVDSTYPAMPPRAVVKYGKVVDDGNTWKLDNIQRVQYGDNDYDHVNKNWVFFEHEGKLLCWHSTSPQTDLLEVSGSEALSIAKTEGPKWKYGTIRGGTTPVGYKGLFLRFFHSALDYEMPPHRRRYFVGAMTMEPVAPFKIIAVSKSPILTGSELDTLSAMERASCAHYKPKVVFPLGCVELGSGKWLLSVGLNDSHCALMSVDADSLNL